MACKCESCDYEGSSHQSLVYHHLSFHNRRTWACRYCDYVGPKKGKIIRHSKTVHLDELNSFDDDLEDFYHQLIDCGDSLDSFLCYFLKQKNQSFKCVFCSDIISAKSELFLHLSNQHPPIKLISLKNVCLKDKKVLRYECKLCHCYCSNEKLLHSHLFASHPNILFSPKLDYVPQVLDFVHELKFKCVECLYSTFIFKDFENHIGRHSSNLKYKCDFCSLTSDYKSIIKKHKIHWHLERNSVKIPLNKIFDDEDKDSYNTLQCNFCEDRFFKNHRALKLHLLGHNNSDSDKELKSQNSFKCDVCYSEFSDFLSLSSHCLEAHDKPFELFKCHKCSFTTNQMHLLSKHTLTHSKMASKQTLKNHLKESKTKQFKCFDCGKIVHGWAYYMAHRKTHLEQTGRGFKSSKKVLTSSKALRFKTAQKGYNFRCPHCPYRAKDGTYLAIHVKCHKQPNRKYLCNRCDYSANSISFIHRHSSVHSLEYMSKFTRDPKSAPQVIEEDKNEEIKISSDEIDEYVKTSIDKCRLVASKSQWNFVLCENVADYSKVECNGDQPLVSFLHCDKCPFIATNVKTFKKHVSLHFLKRQFQCIYCDYSAPSFCFVLTHRTLHHRPNNNLLYMQSLENIEKMSIFKRELDKNLIDHELYSRMYEFSKDFSFNILKPFSCDLCPFSCIDRSTFTLHLSKHANQCEYKCFFCSFSDANKEELKSHIEIHFNFTSSLPQSQNFRNELLTKIFEKFPLDIEAIEWEKCMEFEEFNPENNEKSESKDSANNSTLYCKYCFRCFLSKHHLMKHQDSHVSHSLFLSQALKPS